ncbi:MAG: thiolase family protein [Bdellovibrionota bacterium]
MTSNTPSRPAYIVTGIRTPFVKSGTQFAKVHAAELGRVALSEMLIRTGIPLSEWGALVDEVIIGNTGNPADTANIARVIALRAGLDQRVSAYSVHRNCASALESISQAALKIWYGESDIMIAGGAESMSGMPLIYNNKANKFFETMNKARSLGDKAKAFSHIPVQDFLKPRIALMEGLTDPMCGVNMGQTAEVLAKEFQISRLTQDEFALSSHLKVAKAQVENFFKDEIAPVVLPHDPETVVENDIGPRANQTMEALQKLKPFFDKKHGSITAGNSSPITDGAAMVLVCSEDGLKKLGLSPQAMIRGYAFAGCDPLRMGLGPVFSTHKLLQKTGEKLSDFDVVELNEAFAAQVLACQMAMDSEKFCQQHFNTSKIGSLNSEILNPNGGAIALGHPVGVTGTRIALTATRELKRRNKKKALVTLCIGGGQGGSMSLEAV